MHLIPESLAKSLQAVEGGLEIDAFYAAEFKLKPVRFYPLNELREIKIRIEADEYIDNYEEKMTGIAGTYFEIPAVDLLQHVPGYRSFGVFVWLTDTKEFGTYDDDHGVLRSFPGKSWDDILTTLEKYINCQWYPDGIENHLVRPWMDNRYAHIKPKSHPT